MVQTTTRCPKKSNREEWRQTVTIWQCRGCPEYRGEENQVVKCRLMEYGK